MIENSDQYPQTSAEILGQTNHLRVVKQVDFGVYLDGGNMETILLPKRFVPDNTNLGDSIRVFVYLDSDDIPIATTQRPRIKVGQCAFLKCAEVNNIGAFMDWGLSKDLLIPFGEQSKPMQQGNSYVVFAYIDKASERIAGSTKLSHFLSEQADVNHSVGQSVELLISGRSDLGYKAIIDGTHLGLLHNSEALSSIRIGKKVDAYIQNIRSDGRIDLSLQLHNKASRNNLQQQILDYLQSQDGVSYLTDKSLPEAIYAEFKVSKGSYKKALGGLYKQKLIRIEADQITLL